MLTSLMTTTRREHAGELELLQLMIFHSKLMYVPSSVWVCLLQPHQNLVFEVEEVSVLEYVLASRAVEI